MCQGRYFNHTFDRMHYPNRSILCIVCALFGSLASLEIIPLVAPGILSTFFSIHSYYTLTTSLNHHHETEIFSFKILTLSLISVITQQFILSIDLFVLTLIISSIARTFSSPTRSFPHPISLEELLN